MKCRVIGVICQGKVTQSVRETENRMKGAIRDLEHTEDKAQMTMAANRRVREGQ